MSRAKVDQRQRLIEVASSLIIEHGTTAIHFNHLARQAGVEESVIYQHFVDQTQLIAEAQANIYYGLLAPLHQSLSRAESAIIAKDEEAFWSAVGDNIGLAWASGQPEDKWALVRLLLDVWAHPGTQREFSTLLEVQFHRWMVNAEAARALGWIDETIDTKALLTSIWSASIGQVIFSGSPELQGTPELMRACFLGALKTSGRSN